MPLILLAVLVAASNSADAPSLAFSRRVLTLASTFTGTPERKVAPLRVAGMEGSVLVVFRTSEQGWVIDAKATGGSPQAEQGALNAIRQWKFKPMSINGQPVQIHSALIFSFSGDGAAIQTPRPMTAQQLSPTLPFQCLNGLLHQDPKSVDTCKQQLQTVEQNTNSTAMDRFSAHDEYGLALLNYARDPRSSLEQFTSAIVLASQGLKSSDAEWAYVYWHRATAGQHLGNALEAEKDFATAENSMQQAEHAIADAKMSDYYHGLVRRILTQHAALLETKNKHEQAQQLLNQINQ